MSFKVEVIADNSGQFVGNGLAFATEQEAKDYAVDLTGRWMLVRESRVVSSDEPSGRFAGEGTGETGHGRGIRADSGDGMKHIFIVGGEVVADVTRNKRGRWEICWHRRQFSRERIDSVSAAKRWLTQLFHGQVVESRR